MSAERDDKERNEHARIKKLEATALALEAVLDHDMSEQRLQTVEHILCIMPRPGRGLSGRKLDVKNWIWDLVERAKPKIDFEDLAERVRLAAARILDRVKDTEGTINAAVKNAKRASRFGYHADEGMITNTIIAANGVVADPPVFPIPPHGLRWKP